MKFSSVALLACFVLSLGLLAPGTADAEGAMGKVVRISTSKTGTGIVEVRPDGGGGTRNLFFSASGCADISDRLFKVALLALQSNLRVLYSHLPSASQPEINCLVNLQVYAASQP